MELTGALLTEVLHKVGIVYVDKKGKVFDGLKEDVELSEYIEDAATELKRRLGL